MAENKISIEVKHSGQSGGGNAPPIPSNPYGTIPPAAQAGAQSLGMGNAVMGGNPAPTTVKERDDSVLWMAKRDNYETRYNTILQNRLNTLQSMAKYGYSPQGGYGGGSGNGTGGTGGGRTPNQSNPAAAPPSFMGINAQGWGSIGASMQFGGAAIEAFNFRQMRQTQLQGKTALAENAFKLREMEGDYTGTFFQKERELGKKNAPKEVDMVMGDVAKTAGGTILAAIAGMVGGAALSATGVGAAAGIPMMTMSGAALMGAGGFLGYKALNNLNYSTDLKKRVAEAQTEAQYAEIEKDTVKKKLVDAMSAAGGSTKGILSSVDFMQRLGNSNFISASSGANMGGLLQSMGGGQAEKTLIYNISEGMRLGLDKSEYRKEFDMFSKALTNAEMGANVRTAAGAEEVGRNFSAYMANPTTTAGIAGATSVREYQNNAQQGTGYQATFLSSMHKTYGSKNIDANRAMLALSDPTMNEDDMNVDNPYIQALAQETGRNPTDVAATERKKKHANLEAFNPRLTAARKKAAALPAGIRRGVSSPEKVRQLSAAEVELAQETTAAGGGLFRTPEQLQANLARENPNYQAGINPKKIEAGMAAAPGDLGKNTEDVSKKFETLAGLTQKLIDTINGKINEVNPAPPTSTVSGKGGRPMVAEKAGPR